MPLMKSFADLVQGRVANDPDFAAALQQEVAADDFAPLTTRAALRLIWQAAKYPILGNGDWQTAERLDAEALERAGIALPALGDPPEFAVWIESLRDPLLPDSERGDILSAIYDLFEPEGG